MPPLATASALGNRYFPQFQDICDHLPPAGGRHRLLSPFMVLVWVCLRRILLRVDRLAILWRRGHLPARPATPCAGRQPTANPESEVGPLRRAPQAGRLPGPLCRMFGVTPPPHIFRPPAPRKPRPKKPRAPKPPPFAEHSPSIWPYVPQRLRVPGPPAPGRRRRKLSGWASVLF